jgi:transglutaminase-like putative cysteine protease
MLIRVGYEIEFELCSDTSMLAMLNVHLSRSLDLLEPDEIQPSPAIPLANYFDEFGNRCTRFVAPRGRLRLSCSTVVLDNGRPDPVKPSARECPIGDLPAEALVFLLSSRYCEVDRFGHVAHELFGNTRPGWERVQAICDWVHERMQFDYAKARPTKTALDTFTERVGVCRDFQHLAITLCRAMNIPARYATGYLGDIGVPYGGPMDFSAWFEVFLDNRWWTFDARHNVPRIGRVLMAVGRDAADVALTTSFGQADLKSFFVVTEEETGHARLASGMDSARANEPLALAV